MRAYERRDRVVAKAVASAAAAGVAVGDVKETTTAATVSVSATPAAV
jgi:hypothetical protein